MGIITAHGAEFFWIFQVAGLYIRCQAAKVNSCYTPQCIYQNLYEQIQRTFNFDVVHKY